MSRKNGLGNLSEGSKKRGQRLAKMASPSRSQVTTVIRYPPPVSGYPLPETKVNVVRTRPRVACGTGVGIADSRFRVSRFRVTSSQYQRSTARGFSFPQYVVACLNRQRLHCSCAYPVPRCHCGCCAYPAPLPLRPCCTVSRRLSLGATAQHRSQEPHLTPAPGCGVTGYIVTNQPKDDAP